MNQYTVPKGYDMSTLEQKYQKLLDLALASQYYLEGTDNEDPTALVAYLNSIKPAPVPVLPVAPICRTYVVWNKECTGCETYPELLMKEQDSYSYSSEVTVSNIQEIVEMVVNETNADLGFYLIPALITERIT